jgi:hypothetical protein
LQPIRPADVVFALCRKLRREPDKSAGFARPRRDSARTSHWLQGQSGCEKKIQNLFFVFISLSTGSREARERQPLWPAMPLPALLE